MFSHRGGAFSHNHSLLKTRESTWQVIKIFGLEGDEHDAIPTDDDLIISGPAVLVLRPNRDLLDILHEEIQVWIILSQNSRQFKMSISQAQVNPLA